MLSSFFDQSYLSREQIEGFENYKYSSIDTSPISKYVSHPFWNRVIKIVPLWIAPNVLTLIGAVMVMAGLLLMTVYDYDLNAPAHGRPVPNWTWLVCAVCTFMGHTLDGLDGKQARRTGTSGPTGEMFDHGLDSWATLPFTVTLFSAFGREEYSIEAVRTLGILISVQLVFIVTHWEKYNTGVLFLSWGYDASQYALSIFYLVTWVLGSDWVRFYVYGSVVSFANLLEVLFYTTCGISVLMSFYNLQHAYFVTATGKHSSLAEIVRPLLPFLLLCVTSLVWAVYSRTSVIDVDPRAFLTLNGTVFANMASRLVISQMSSTRAEVTNVMIYPLCVAAVIFSTVNCGVGEVWTLRVLVLFVIIGHIHYGVCVVRQMCEHFNIRAFTISAPDSKTD